MRRVMINDITLRDGEQAAGVNFFPEEKLQIARQLAKMNIPIIEAGFAVASEVDFQAIQSIGQELGTKDGPIICSMARANKRDIEMASEAVSTAHKGRVQVVMGTSDIHLKYKFGMTRSEVKDIVFETVRYARTLVDDVEFAAEDSTRSDLDFLVEVMLAAQEAGARTLELPDTTGYSTPQEYGHIVKTIVDSVREETVVATHTHNDLGLAVANTLVGLMVGARQLEVTVNGIGERVGNASLEEVIMALKTREDFFKVNLGIDSTEIMTTSQLVEKLSGIQIAKNKPIVGANAFRHESGIHQDGLLKNKNTYQIMEPSDIGLDGYGLVLGKLSGRHAFKKKVESMGYSLSEKVMNGLYEEFKQLASKKKFVLTEDIESLLKRHDQTVSAVR